MTTSARGGFTCKQFTVLHDKCAMKVGTDSLILGSSANVADAQRILDVGTGSGLLALMVAQKSPAACIIDAIEPDSGAVEQARENVAASPWPDKITVHMTTLQVFSPTGKYDVIVANPPYFQEPLKSSAAFELHQGARKQARRDDTLPPETLFRRCAEMLPHSGRLYCLYPHSRVAHIVSAAASGGLQLISQTSIKPTPLKAPHVALMEFSQTRPEKVRQTELIVRNENNTYSDDFIALCRDFYLNFP